MCTIFIEPKSANGLVIPARELKYSFPFLVSADGTRHNLNEYMKISSAEVAKNIENDGINAVFTRRYGIVVSEGQLANFFSQISHQSCVLEAMA